jgi:hypothetical protein
MTWLRRFFAPAVGPRPTAPRRLRPTLEALDTRVVPTVYAAGNFPANAVSQAGVFRHSSDAGGWQQLKYGLEASEVAVDGHGTVVAEFPTIGGVWRFEDATGWQHLTASNVTQLAMAGNGNVVVENPGYGVWRFEDATGWQHLGTWDAAQVGIDSAGDVVASFIGHGVYRYEDATGWQQLNVFTPPGTGTLGIADGGIVVADLPGTVNQYGYGDYSGVYLYQDGSSWIKISNFYATSLGLATP